MKRWSIIVVVLWLSGCTTLRERHVIVPIPGMDERLDSREDPLREAGPKAGHGPSNGFDRGAWLYRMVYAPRLRGHELEAIEILFCPIDVKDYSTCRIGIAWSRIGTPLGAEGDHTQ